MGLRRAGLLGLAFSFARSERGQRFIRDTRQKYDTPENRDRARQAVSGLRSRGRDAQVEPFAGPTAVPTAAPAAAPTSAPVTATTPGITRSR